MAQITATELENYLKGKLNSSRSKSLSITIPSTTIKVKNTASTSGAQQSQYYPSNTFNTDPTAAIGADYYPAIGYTGGITYWTNYTYSNLNMNVTLSYMMNNTSNGQFQSNTVLTADSLYNFILNSNFQYTNNYSTGSLSFSTGTSYRSYGAAEDIIVSTNLGVFYTYFHSYVTKYGYSGGYSSSSTLGRFWCSPEDMCSICGIANKNTLWRGCSNEYGSYGSIYTYSNPSATTYNIVRKANDRYGFYVKYGSTYSSRIGNKYGYLGYMRIYKYTGDGITNPANRQLISEFSAYESESSVDYTTSHDSSMKSQFPSFVNNPLYNTEYTLVSVSISSGWGLYIEFAQLDNDSNFYVL